MRDEHAMRVIAYACILIMLLFSSAVVAYDVIGTWRARSLIRALKTIEVGKTTGRDAIGIAKRFGGTALIVEHTVTKTTDTTSWHDVPMGTCIAGDCELTFAARRTLPAFRPVAEFLCRHPGLRRRVPVSDVGVDVEIKRGVVQELHAWMASLDDEVEHCGRTNVYSRESHAAPWNRTPWSIRKVHAHITGGPGRSTNEIRVEAWSSAPHDRILRALDFNTRCLWLGYRCTPCEILPSACDAYNHGDWSEFEMPEVALVKFRNAVNNLALDADVRALYDQLGSNNEFGREQKLRDLTRDRLPFDFPDGAILGPPCSGELNFYVKKWRLDWGSPAGSGDRSVTFVMDDDCRLKRIESGVEGIASRP
jgi:hypothetical protein